jgi:hypothetical protein
MGVWITQDEFVKDEFRTENPNNLALLMRWKFQNEKKFLKLFKNSAVKKQINVWLNSTQFVANAFEDFRVDCPYTNEAARKMLNQLKKYVADAEEIKTEQK